MSTDNVKMIESDFIQTWEEKEQRKKREFMDDMYNEKEKLEKTEFFLLDIEEESFRFDSLKTNEFMINSNRSLNKSLTIANDSQKILARWGRLDARPTRDRPENNAKNGDRNGNETENSETAEGFEKAKA